MTIKKSIPKPPGGQLVCASDQLAIVEIRNGEVFAECHSPPARMRASRFQSLSQTNKELTLSNWVLSEVIGQRRAPLQDLTEYDRQILLEKQYLKTDPVSGESTTIEFKLPRDLSLSDGGGTTDSAQ